MSLPPVVSIWPIEPVGTVGTVRRVTPPVQVPIPLVDGRVVGIVAATTTAFGRSMDSLSSNVSIESIEPVIEAETTTFGDSIMSLPPVVSIWPIEPVGTVGTVRRVTPHRKKITTGLVELAAVMATDKVYKKRQKLFQISYKKNA
jgi:hypothetical protein